MNIVSPSTWTPEEAVHIPGKVPIDSRTFIRREQSLMTISLASPLLVDPMLWSDWML